MISLVVGVRLLVIGCSELGFMAATAAETRIRPNAESLVSLGRSA